MTRGKSSSVAIVVAVTLAAAMSAGLGGTRSAEAAANRAAEKPAVKISFSAALPQVEKVPTILAAEDLKKRGYPVSLDYMQSPSDAVQAVITGADDIGSATTSSVFAAISTGAPITVIMSANSPGYQVFAPTSVQGPAGLDGMRVGIHAAVSSTTLYTDLMLAKFPDVKPKILVVPGSANRIRAMVAGQLDASAIQLSDIPSLEDLAPGKFHDIYDIAKKWPFIMDAVIFVRTSMLQQNRPLVKTVLEQILKEQRQAYASPGRLADAIQRLVPGVSADVAQQDAKTYTDDRIWPTNGGFTAKDVQYTLNSVKFGGFLKAPLTVSQCCDLSLLKEINAPRKVQASLVGARATISPRAGYSTGEYVFVVRDRSKKDGFGLFGKGVSKKTGAKFRGTASWKLKLAAGRYSYGSVNNPKLRHRLVVSSH
jgi:ABC-type nitrate/sulfonate/bicarbonate transport system substrate-binding protein